MPRSPRAAGAAHAGVAHAGATRSVMSATSSWLGAGTPSALESAPTSGRYGTTNG